MHLGESGICSAKEQDLILVPGLGDKKVKRLYQALHEPFRTVKQKVARNDSNSASSSTSSSSNTEMVESFAAPIVVSSTDEISGGVVRSGDSSQSIIQKRQHDMT